MMTRLVQTWTSRREFIASALLTCATLLAYPVFSAAATTVDDLKADAVFRCHNVVGEFGADAIDICVKGEFAAMRALMSYPPEHGDFVRGCTRHVAITGWEAAKSCADKEIAAARELKKD